MFITAICIIKDISNSLQRWIRKITVFMELIEKSDRQIFREEIGEAIGVVCVHIQRQNSNS